MLPARSSRWSRAARASSSCSIPTTCRCIEKIRTIATEIYRADDIEAAKPVRDQLANFESMGYGKLPVCIAKTQYSFSTNPDLKGAPTGFTIPVREVRLSAGAEFVVAICGEIMTMPGLPRVPAAEAIDVVPTARSSGCSDAAAFAPVFPVSCFVDANLACRA